MSLGNWITGRPVSVPIQFASVLDREGSGGAEALSVRAIGELLGSLDESKVVHGAAFKLLAADAHLTYACQRIMEVEEGPGDVLVALALRFAGGRS